MFFFLDSIKELPCKEALWGQALQRRLIPRSQEARAAYLRSGKIQTALLPRNLSFLISYPGSYWTSALLYPFEPSNSLPPSFLFGVDI